MASENMCSYLQVPRKKAIIQSSPVHKARHCSMLADLNDLENLRIKSSPAANHQDNRKNQKSVSSSPVNYSPMNGKEYAKNGKRDEQEEEKLTRATQRSAEKEVTGPQAPARRRRRSKRRKSELEECPEKKENAVTTIGISDLPGELDQLLKESERQLQQLKTDDILRNESNGDAPKEKKSGELYYLSSNYIIRSSFHDT